MKQMKAVLLIAFLCLSAFACSEDKTDTPNFPRVDSGNNDNNQTNNQTNNTVDDMEVADTGTDMGPNNNGMPDLSVDLNVMQPGFLHGTWTVEVLDGDPEIEGQFATFTFRHEEGEESATGIFKVQAGEGTLNQVLWQDDTLSTSFSIRINNINERFGVSMGTPSDQDTINGRYSWDANGTFGNVQLVRVTDQ